MSKDFYVYVAGPLTTGLTTSNIRAAAIAAGFIMDHGMIPFLPHTNVLAEMICPRSEREWLEWDFKWLARCDAVFRLPGVSHGADQEEALAKELGIPVVCYYEDLLNLYKENCL